MSPVLYIKILATLALISLVFLFAQTPTCVLAGKMPPGRSGMLNLRLGEQDYPRRSGLATSNRRHRRRMPKGHAVGLSSSSLPRLSGQRQPSRKLRVQG
uniref:Secreted protein n=1 Tax=Rhipicephalus appendiculatus TaxID=34631 RepID=A0A131YIE5_RHIAP